MSSSGNKSFDSGEAIDAIFMDTDSEHEPVADDSENDDVTEGTHPDGVASVTEVESAEGVAAEAGDGSSQLLSPVAVVSPSSVSAGTCPVEQSASNVTALSEESASDARGVSRGNVQDVVPEIDDESQGTVASDSSVDTPAVDSATDSTAVCEPATDDAGVVEVAVHVQGDNSEIDNNSDSSSSDSELDEDDYVDSHTSMHEADNSEQAKDNTQWTRRNDKPSAVPFSETPGLKEKPPNDALPLFFMKLFFTAQFWQLLVTETNRYATQYLAKFKDTLGPHARARAWTPVTIPDMKTFIALYLLTGLIFKPQLQHYWSSDPLYSTPPFPAAMSRNRFMLILQFLHFSNNEDQTTAQDKLRKLRPLVQLLVTRFQQLYIPTREISIDEELVLFKGRLAFKQYIPNKRSRFGVKIFALCDSHGYYWNATVFCGTPTPAYPLTNILGATGSTYRPYAIYTSRQGLLSVRGQLLYLHKASRLFAQHPENWSMWYYESQSCGNPNSSEEFRCA